MYVVAANRAVVRVRMVSSTLNVRRWYNVYVW